MELADGEQDSKGLLLDKSNVLLLARIVNIADDKKNPPMFAADRSKKERLTTCRE